MVSQLCMNTYKCVQLLNIGGALSVLNLFAGLSYLGSLLTVVQFLHRHKCSSKRPAMVGPDGKARTTARCGIT